MTAAAIGHNQGPTPFDDLCERIADLNDEARSWLDGEPITSQPQADAVNLLITMIRAAAKEADELRRDEARPHDEAKAVIQARYNVLIGDTKSIKGVTVLALDAAKAALTPWLEQVEAEKRAVERKAREEADAARRIAEEAFRASQVTDLAAREEAERLADLARRADKAATAATNDRARAKGGAGRATGLRTYYRAEVVDPVAFARCAWADHRAAMSEFLDTLAAALVQTNHSRAIPGVIIHEEKRAV